MAGKPRNRMELRRQYEAAEPLDPMEDENDDTGADSDDGEDEPKPKKKPRAAAVKKPKASKSAKPAARMRVVWQVVNDAFKPVGTFEFNQKEAAEARAAELTARGKGTHFVQKVKEPLADDAPGLGAAIPRLAEATATPARTTKRTKAAKVEDEEPIEEEEFEEEDEEEEEEEEEEDYE